MNPAGVGRSGFVERHAPWTPAQHEAARAALALVAERNIKTVRLAFADQHGILRGKTIVADLLPSIFRNGCGMTTTLLSKDTSHRTVYPVWSGGGGIGMSEMTGASDFVAVPDPTTFRVLPWVDHSAWVLCDAYFQNGEPVPFSSRYQCAQQLQRLGAAGYDYLVGVELEFYVYRMQNSRHTIADSATPAGPAPEVLPLSRGFQYLTETRYDELDPILDRLREDLLALGLPVRTLEVEFGPSQCELTFGPVAGVAAADNVVLARSAIKQICRRLGLHATFMCRPALPGAMSSGWHLHQSLIERSSGRNAFMSTQDELPLSADGMAFMAGLLRHARESSLLAVPTINGYKRFRPFSLAPNNIVWGRDNRGAMLRVIGGTDDPASHIENRIGESAANPYLYFVSQIVSGLAGMEQQLDPGPAVDTPYAPGSELLPRSLVEAVAALRGSTLFEAQLGRRFIDYLLTIKEFELHRFLSDEVTDWEQREYFDVF
ncbi:glutamine synthetase [Solimonas sp. C16B3]|uniref:Glutamine synthetase n=1 Tax=Solimonas marina TaxID=2714601 RepID=A0A969WAU0_9GAMM|nr:glutamine synthetase [Solimonas marina]